MYYFRKARSEYYLGMMLEMYFVFVKNVYDVTVDLYDREYSQNTPN